jgi:hypothetical protein
MKAHDVGQTALCKQPSQNLGRPFNHVTGPAIEAALLQLLLSQRMSQVANVRVEAARDLANSRESIAVASVGRQSWFDAVEPVEIGIVCAQDGLNLS